ncbi:hypothetical protein F901_02011 [Acinetobacter dispersus]|nr:hypothetical protein F901_02011 [Acinetobacter dispersus]
MPSNTPPYNYNTILIALNWILARFLCTKTGKIYQFQAKTPFLYIKKAPA